MDEARYLTDDRDFDRRNELVIRPGTNGDWYVGVCPEGEGCMGRMVRLCASGGASSCCPGLMAAIAEAYHCIVSERSSADAGVCDEACSDTHGLHCCEKIVGHDGLCECHCGFKWPNAEIRGMCPKEEDHE